jgi:mono/diheme cytochrome c family protein
MLVKSHKWLAVILSISAAILLLTGVLTAGQMTRVGAHDETSTPTAEPDNGHQEGEQESTPEPTEELTAEEQALIETGHQAFQDEGCSACHGEDAEGTDLAPALAGHSEAAVRRQVRAPVGNMPVYPPDKLSDDELDAIAAYISHLEGGHEHMHLEGEVSPTVSDHLWMALYALEDENPRDVDDAVHHVQYAIDLVDDPEQKEVLEDIQQQLLDGDAHEAGHAIEDILADIGGPSASPALIHLQLALAAVRVEDVDEAVHHLNHYLETATDTQHDQGEEILTMVENGEWSEADQHLQDLITVVSEQESQTSHRRTITRTQVMKTITMTELMADEHRAISPTVSRRFPRGEPDTVSCSR